MTPILKKQLSALCALTVLGGALTWNATASRAQEDLPARGTPSFPNRIPLSRDAAARSFAALLDMSDPASRGPRTLPGAPSTSSLPAMMSSFSKSSESPQLSALLIKMGQQWKEPKVSVKVQSETDDTATVVLQSTVATSESRPLVMVKEGDSWGVDVPETYAQWNGLEGEAKTAALAAIATDVYKERDQMRRNSCQTNMKQVALGLLQYIQDYDEKLPPAKAWNDLIYPYVKTDYI
ncbi:MAG: DUF1559 domain-containing protein, partial [Proteobacteria bacterium]